MAKTIGKVPEKMNAQLDAGGAPFWSPEEVGDEIGGTVITVADTTSVKFPSKGTFKVITVGTADGDYRIDCGGAVLKRLVGDLAPKPGDFVAVRYLGEGPDKKAGNKPCQRFGMVVERAPEE